MGCHNQTHSLPSKRPCSSHKSSLPVIPSVRNLPLRAAAGNAPSAVLGPPSNVTPHLVRPPHQTLKSPSLSSASSLLPCFLFPPSTYGHVPLYIFNVCAPCHSPCSGRNGIHPASPNTPTCLCLGRDQQEDALSSLPCS